ncbi:MAG: hypothetical protein RLZZ422_2784, partial [Pseudomonadota bacterium]
MSIKLVALVSSLLLATSVHAADAQAKPQHSSKAAKPAPTVAAADWASRPAVVTFTDEYAYVNTPQGVAIVPTEALSSKPVTKSKPAKKKKKAKKKAKKAKSVVATPAKVEAAKPATNPVKPDVPKVPDAPKVEEPKKVEAAKPVQAEPPKAAETPTPAKVEAAKP